jgi:hypothetical protein
MEHLVQTIHEPQGNKRQHFFLMQKGARKDVKHCFGMFQVHFAIIYNPNR